MEGTSEQQPATHQTTSDTSNEPSPTLETTPPSPLPTRQQRRNFALTKALALGMLIIISDLVLTMILLYHYHYQLVEHFQFFTLSYIAAPTLFSILLGLLIASPTTLWPRPSFKRLMVIMVLLSYVLSGVFWFLRYILPEYNIVLPFLPEYSIVLPFLTALLLTLLSIGYTPKLSTWTGFAGYNKVSTATETTSTPPKVTKTEEYLPGKTLWDWLQLLIIPAILAAGALWFNAHQDYLNQQTTMNQQQEAALQGYLDKMSDLLLKNEFSDSKTQAQASQLGRVWTLTVLRQLDSDRKAIVLRFLYDANLIGKYIPPRTKKDTATILKPIIDLHDAAFFNINFSSSSSMVSLSGADLHGADLSVVDLSHADLRDTFINNANFDNANLSFANLSGDKLFKVILEDAHLTDADLRNTIISNCDLSSADLERAKLHGAFFAETDLSWANLKGATDFNSFAVKSLYQTTMPDGSVHP